MRLGSEYTVASCVLFFFFQAEDGIRDYKVTGVQTCALPISLLGVACCGLATLALRKVLGWFMRGGTLWDIQLLLVLLLPLGLSLLRDAGRRGFYLRVEVNRGARKFPFVGGLDERFPDFVRHAELLSRKTIDSREYPWAGGLTSA